MQPSGVLTADIPYTARFLWLTIQELQAQSPEDDGVQISHEALGALIGRGRRQVIRLCDILQGKGFIRVTRAAVNSKIANTYHAVCDAQMSHSPEPVDGEMSHKESVVVDSDSLLEGEEKHESKQMYLKNKQQLCDRASSDASPGESAQPGDGEGVERRADIDPVVAEVFHPRTAAEMITRYGADRVKVVCAAAKSARNPGGYAREALENYWQMPLPFPTPIPPHSDGEGVSAGEENERGWKEYGAQINVDYEVILEERRREAEAQRKREEAANHSQAARLEAAARTPEAKLWEVAYSQLELQLDRASFQTWLRGAAFAGMDDGKYIIQVKNGYARDMLQHRLYRNIRRVLSDVAGQGVELRFVAAGVPPSVGDGEGEKARV